MMDLPSPQSRPCLAGHVRQQVDLVSGEPVLLYPEGILFLNETAQAILARCDGRTLAEVIAALAEEYDAPPEQLAGEVGTCLRDLRARQLVEW